MSSQQEALTNYSNSIKRLRAQSRQVGISEEEFINTYMKSLKKIESKSNTITNTQSMLKYIAVLLLIIILSVCYYKNIYNSVFCSFEEYIYPCLRFLRQLSIPFISLFPSLTEYYDETCLIHNPFFTVVDLDCWPCSTVVNVREINNPVPNSDQNNAPFIYETEQEIIYLETLENVYKKNKNVFDTDAYKVIMDNKYDITPNEMFELLKKNYSHESHLFIWKFNRINPSRIIRLLIPRPKVVPKFGQSPERFLIVDASQKTFKIPDTECNFSFLLSVKGSRKINLIPAEECKHQCKSLSIVLKESYLLWYNWWYWRPTVQPSLSNDTFIGHLGSYC